MKSTMPYRGVPTPLMRTRVRAIFAAHPLATFEEWRDTVLALWRQAGYREERYAAIGLASWPKYRAFQTLDALPLFEEMISTGAWWDYVDSLASRNIGELLRHYPKEMKPVLRGWAVSGDMWKRRSAILAQLNFKSETDLRLLYACIRPSLQPAPESAEFFLRKAIGWALRQYARIDPGEVKRYVEKNAAQMSGLTRREALKHVSLKQVSV